MNPSVSFRLLCASLLALVATSDLMAQRRGRRFRSAGSPTAAPTPPPKPESKPEEVKNWTAIKGGTVYVGTGQIIHRATVLIGDNKIVEVGPGIEIPEGAKIIDATGRYLSPGFVIIGARGMGAGSTADNPADSVNPYDPQIKMGLAAGITSFLVQSGSGSSRPTGSSAVFKCAYGDVKGMVLDHGNVYQMRVPLTISQMKSFRDLVGKVKEYKKKKAEGTAKSTAKPATSTKKPSGSSRGSRGTRSSKSSGPKLPSGGAEVLKIMEGKARLWVGSRRGYSNERIRQAMEIARLLGVGVVLSDPTTAWSIPDEIAATGSMVVLSPRENVQPDPAKPKTTGSNIAMARILSEAGVPVAVHPPSGRFGGASLGTGGILGQDLNTPHIDAAYAVRGGLDNRKALRTITLDAARMLGVADRVGSIEKGKDADILILDGQPLHYRTFVETAIVNGKVVYEKDKEPFYRHIKR